MYWKILWQNQYNFFLYQCFFYCFTLLLILFFNLFYLIIEYGMLHIYIGWPIVKK